jgi:hypothetical protein
VGHLVDLDLNDDDDAKIESLIALTPLGTLELPAYKGYHDSDLMELSLGGEPLGEEGSPSIDDGGSITGANSG